MAQTAASLAAISKEVYTQDELEKQFYSEAPVLERFEKTNRYTIGREARVPIHKYGGGGTTVLTAAGGTLNPDDAQDVDKAVYTLSYAWQPIAIQFGALNEVHGGQSSVGDSLTLEVEGGVNDLRRQVMRMAAANGDALIAECATSTATTTINLSPTGLGYHAIIAGYLSPGITIDIGSAANETSVAGDRLITDVNDSESDPEIVINGANVTTAAGDFISLANARSGATSNEFPGLRSMVGSSTTVVGGLDPATTGKRFWKPAHVDTTTTAYSLDLPLTMQRKVFSKTRRYPTWFLTSPKQQANHYSLLQTQVRFSGDMQLGAGNVEQAKWNGMEFMGEPDIPDKELYLLDPASFLIVTGKYSKPTWASDIEGFNKGLGYVQGATSFKDALVYACALATRRRNANAAAISLTG
jgi:hypothetical protein